MSGRRGTRGKRVRQVCFAAPFIERLGMEKPIERGPWGEYLARMCGVGANPERLAMESPDLARDVSSLVELNAGAWKGMNERHAGESFDAYLEVRESKKAKRHEHFDEDRGLLFDGAAVSVASRDAVWDGSAPPALIVAKLCGLTDADVDAKEKLGRWLRDPRVGDHGLRECAERLWNEMNGPDAGSRKEPVRNPFGYFAALVKERIDGARSEAGALEAGASETGGSTSN